MVEWQVFRDGTQESDVFDVAPVVDTINPFGDYAVVKIDDSQGAKFDQYQRGTELELKVIPEPGDTPISRFVGYVVERRELDQDGADVLEVEAYTFDQFLRRNTVSNDQTGNTISEALADIIQTGTPITYNASNVEVGDPQELTRSYRGEPVESALRDLAFKSTNENLGVNDSREFFFRPRETVHIDRGIDNETWLNYDIPELGKEEINEVEVWFDDGNESVIVDNGQSKLDLEESLGLASPGTQRAEINRPRLTDISDAEDAGRQYLKFRNTTLSGEITTFGLFNATPGDTIDVTIPQRGINTEFQIVSIEYEWGRDETRVEVVEKRGFTDDILVRLGEAIQREEMQGADRDAPKNRITTTQAGAIVDVSVSADGNTPDDTRFVNPGRNKLRDGWKGDGNPDITTLVVGDDNSGLSRSNTTLVNQTNSATVAENLPSAKVVEYSATITQTGVQELGLETTDGTLICRAIFDTAVDLGGSVTVTLTVSNDDSVDRGVLTNDGQTAVRDVLADNSPTLPTDYAYGSSGTTVAETDTALGNELVSVSLDSVLLQSADTQSEWESLIGTIASSEPATIDSTGPRTTQIAYTQEGEDFFNADQGFDEGSTDTDISNNDYVSLSTGDGLSGGPDFAEWQFTIDKTIPGSDFKAYVRDASNSDGAPALIWTLEHSNGQTYNLDENTTVGVNIQDDFSWVSLPNFSGASFAEEPADLEAGTTHTLRVEITDSGGSAQQYQYWIDVVAPIDARFESDLTFDETVDANNYLSGPEKYPELYETSLATADTRRNVTESNFVLSANDVSNQFYVELANDGSTFTRINNSQTGSVTFASGDRGVDVNIGIGRYSATTTQTPTNGNDFQQIDSWELFANPDAVLAEAIGETVTRAVVPQDTSGIVGNTVRECGLKNGSTLLTRHELADFVLESGQRLASSESTTFKGTE